MVICGAPDAQPRHAEHITDFALSIINATSKINDPSTNQSLKIRVGESRQFNSYLYCLHNALPRLSLQ